MMLPEALEDPRHIAEAEHKLSPGPEGPIHLSMGPPIYRSFELDGQYERLARQAPTPL